MFFKKVKNSILVDSPIIELYIPADYADSELYEVVGENARFLCIGSYKVFKTEKEREDIESVKTYPIAIPAFVLSHPTETSIKEVRMTPKHHYTKSIVMTFYMNDAFIVNCDIIKSTDNVMALMQRLESGKLDNIPPSIVDEVIEYAQSINAVNLRAPSEMREILVAERYRDPNNPSRKLRFSAKADPSKAVSYNMREEAMQSTTYQGITHEDINSAIITAVNRKEKGIKDDATIMEKVIRGEKIVDSE